jgi:hypothetical protein
MIGVPILLYLLLSTLIDMSIAHSCHWWVLLAVLAEMTLAVMLLFLASLIERR